MGGDREMGPGMRGEGGMHGGFRIAPPGLWWKNPMLVQQIGITPDQQKKMDDILQQSRLQLIDLKANVERQELLLHPMLDANPPDTAKVLAQIDKLAQARADLEKSNAKMLLGIRTVLTPDQWTKLQQQEHSHHGMMGRGPDGMRGMRGPGGQQPQPGADHSELQPAPDAAPGTPAAQE
jgi:Spy/CpxP family protein refolding chaperone